MTCLILGASQRCGLVVHALLICLTTGVYAQSTAPSGGAIDFDVIGTDADGQPILVNVSAQEGPPNPALAQLNPAVGPVVAVVPDAGQPQPVLILGQVPVGAERIFGIPTLLRATAQEYDFDYAQAEQREAVRRDEPTIFEQMVQEGWIAPNPRPDAPTREIAYATQTLLQEFGCYTAGIDGAWGGGSTRGMQNYLTKSGMTVPDATDGSDIRLFRTVLMGGTVTCDPVVEAVQQVTVPSRDTVQPAPEPVIYVEPDDTPVEPDPVVQPAPEPDDFSREIGAGQRRPNR